MANWQNVEAPAALVEMIQKAAREAFAEATGQEMPEGFGNWSFRKMRGEYIFGIEMEAAEKALASKAKASGNVAKHDGETRAAIVAWVEYLGAGNGKLQDVPEVIRAAVSRAMQPAAESLMPPTRKVESLLPPAKAEQKMPAKGMGVLSNAAAINAARRMTRKAG